MAYATRWDIPFKDIQGTLHHIYIQQDGWTGSVTTLRGGDTPIDWDEDNSDDLLNRVRAKTGHIEVIEQNYGDLADLYPTTAKSHRIVVPGMFFGYIKPQSSTMNWAAGPRVLKFNILSPLAMADDIPMMTINSLGSIVYMDWVFFNLMDIMEYDYIIMPVGTTTYTEAFNGELYNKIISPYSDEKEYKMATDADAYKPISVEEFLTKYCDTHNLVAYDNITGSDSVLLFTRFVNAGNYYMWSRDQIGGDISDGTIISSDVLTDLFNGRTLAGNSNKEKLLIPYSGIDVYYDGEVFGDAEWPVQRSLFTKTSSTAGDLTPRGRWLELSQYASLKTRMVAQQGVENKAEKYLRVYRTGTLPTSQEKECEIWFDNLAPYNEYTVKITFGGTTPTTGKIYAIIDRSLVEIDLSTLDTDMVFTIDTFPESDQAGCLGITFYCMQGYVNQFDVYHVSVKKEANFWNSGIDEIYKDNNYVISIEGTVGVKRMEYRIPWNQNFLSNWYDTQLAYAGNPYPVYLLQSQTKAEITVRASNFPSSLYLQKYYIDQTGRRWRIVAISRSPRMCEAKITLISSYILE